MGTVWRLQTRTDNSEGGKISSYCLENRVVAIGWSLKDEHLDWYNPNKKTEIQAHRDKIKTIEDY